MFRTNCSRVLVLASRDVWVWLQSRSSEILRLVESSTFGGNERQVTFRIGSETARVFSTMWFHNDILIPEATVTKPDNP